MVGVNRGLTIAVYPMQCKRPTPVRGYGWLDCELGDNEFVGQTCSSRTSNIGSSRKGGRVDDFYKAF